MTDGARYSGRLVETRELARDYGRGERAVHALRGVDLRVRRGEFVALRGRSGAGKTTLLNLLGGLDRPTGGTVEVDGREISHLGEDKLVEFRRRTVGFVFQAYGLIPILSAAENVELPLRLIAAEPRERDRRVRLLLDLVGLADRARHRPHELSGGEQQRVAIARALANQPRLLLADEPTGQLDSHSARAIMSLLQAAVQHEGATAIVATHDQLLLDIADRVIEIRDGKLVGSADSGTASAQPPPAH